MELFEQHFDAAFAAPDGIKKLRELILTLAMQGKLIPQDPNDLPASQLMKEIEAEKKRLVKEGKIEVPKSLSTVKRIEAQYALPKTWKWVRFGDIAQHNSGKTLDKGRNTGQLHDYITTSNLYWGHFRLENVRQMLIRKEELERCTARRNDLLICEGGEAGRAAVWDYETDICFQNHIHRARFYGNINPYFSYRFFEKLNATREIDQYRKGVGISNMSSKTLASINFPLPPLPEQHRIVAKIDQLMARCDDLEKLRTEREQKRRSIHTAALKQLLDVQASDKFADVWKFITQNFSELYAVKENVAELRKAILQLGVMGKLVPQNPNDQPASQLLKEIEAEKKRLVKEGKIKAPKPLSTIKLEDMPYALPQGWEWVRLGYIGDFINGDRGKNYPNREEYVSEGIPWINTGHIEPDGFLTQSEMYFIRRNKFESLNGGKIAPGDLVYCLRGATFGKTAIVDPYSEGAIASSLMIIRPYRQCSNRYLYRYLVSPLGRSQIFKFNNGSAQPNLSSSNVQLYIFPLPPLPEQHRIIAKIDQLMTLCDALEKDINNATGKQTELLDAVMAQV